MSTLCSLDESVDAAVRILQARRDMLRDARPGGVATGFDEIDRLTDGMHPGEVILCAGRPGMGASDYLLSVVANVAIGEHRPVALFSPTLPTAQVIHHLVSPLCGVELRHMQSGEVDHESWDAFVRATDQLRGLRLVIDDSPELSLATLRARVAMLSTQGVDFIAVDAAMGVGAPRMPPGTLAGLKQIAKVLNVPVLVAATLGRGLDARRDHRPILADLREVGIDHAQADTILFLYRDDYYTPGSVDAGLAEVTIAKQARGRKGSVKLAWSDGYRRFSNYPPLNPAFAVAGD